MVPDIDPQLRRRNLRAAWLLGGFALFLALTSVPFWKGLAKLIAASAP